MKKNSMIAALILVAFFSISSFAQSGKTSGVTILRDADQPAKQPFDKNTGANFSDLITVPAGKVLVIENVTGMVYSTAGEIVPLGLYVLDLTNQYLPVKQSHLFAPTYQTNTNKTFYTHLTRFYIPAGQTLRVFWDGVAQPVVFSVNVSGYYVDVP